MSTALALLITGGGFLCLLALLTYALCAVAKDVDDMIERRSQGDLYLVADGDPDVDLAWWLAEVVRDERVGAEG